jgi:protein-ribulosamine 3-kinase
LIPQEVSAWLQEEGHGAVVSEEPISGGCINNGAFIETKNGQRYFIKTNSSAPKDMFAREFESLEALRMAAAVRVPDVHLTGEDFILLEDLAPAPRAADYWETLGRQLARQHQHVDQQFGFAHDNYLGSTPQPNSRTSDGYEFFAEHRLGFQVRLARNNDLLSSGELLEFDDLIGKLSDLIPIQPASLIHGDLWGGNAISDSAGQPALIDPASHYGWAEAELGMTALFGGFGQAFYAAYEAERPLERGWQERLDIYNLYHLLNHLNLFGHSYHGQLVSILRRYA